MSAATLEAVLEQVKELTPEEQQKVRELLNSLSEEPKLRMTLEEVERKMVEDGLLRGIPPPISDITPYKNRRLIEVKGKPLSETIIEERR